MRTPLLAGIGVGFLAGWLVFGLGRDEAPPRRGERSKEMPKPVDPATRPEPATTKAKSNTGPKPLDARWMAKAGGRSLQVESSRLERRQVKATPEAVALAIQRVDEARAARDWPLFVGLVRFLAASGAPDAQGKLVELMGDTTLEFHDWRIAQHFREGLAGAQVEGVAAAARRRIECEKSLGGSRWRYPSWFEFVARHGAEADLDWLLEFRNDRQAQHQIFEALAVASGRTGVADRLMDAWRNGGVRFGADGVGRAFAKSNPEAAYTFLRDRFEQSPKTASRQYGYSVTKDKLDDARGLLLGLKDPEKRTLAVYAVEAMHNNRLDISGFEPILLAPVEEAERLAGATPEEQRRGYYGVMYAIEYDKVVWSERAAAALEELATRYPDKGRADGLRDVARQVRAGIGSAKSDWVTTR